MVCPEEKYIKEAILKNLQNIHRLYLIPTYGIL